MRQRLPQSMRCKKWQQFTASLSPVLAPSQEGILRGLRVTSHIQEHRIVLAVREVGAEEELTQQLLIAHYERGLIEQPIEAHVAQCGVCTGERTLITLLPMRE